MLIYSIDTLGDCLGSQAAKPVTRFEEIWIERSEKSQKYKTYKSSKNEEHYIRRRLFAPLSKLLFLKSEIAACPVAGSSSLDRYSPGREQPPMDMEGQKPVGRGGCVVYIPKKVL